MGTLWDFNFWKISNIPGSKAISEAIQGSEHPGAENVISYRKYTNHKAMQVWKDHPLWGVGPGMFGGLNSIMYNSFFLKNNWWFFKNVAIFICIVLSGIRAGSI
jgi:O-antigen ligase